MLRTHCAQILQDVVDRLRGPHAARFGGAAPYRAAPSGVQAELVEDDDELARLDRGFDRELAYANDVTLDVLLVRSGDTTYVTCHVQPARSQGIPVVRVIGLVTADEDV
jgi:hypothetical protein